MGGWRLGNIEISIKIDINLLKCSKINYLNIDKRIAKLAL
jgi:hypothetical protein